MGPVEPLMSSGRKITTMTEKDRVLSQCISIRADIAQDRALREGSDVRTAIRDEESHESYLHSYGQAPIAGMEVRLAYLRSIKPRRVGDAGEVRCGDLLGAHTRRLCGGCSRPDATSSDGCGDLRERLDH